MTTFNIDFEPVGRRGQCQKGESLLACARQIGVGISSVCGGKGTCHACKVHVVEGVVSRPTPNERGAFTASELKKGWRLACQTYPASDCKIDVPAESMTTPQRLQVEGLEVRVSPEPPVVAYHLQLAAPSLETPQADADNLLKALRQQHKLRASKIDIGALRTISDQLRSWKWECQVAVRDGEVIAILHPNRSQLGLAIDLGTTKVAGYLVDLANGRTLAARGIMNPQISHGEDIISRISAAMKSADTALQLQRLAARAINELCTDLCAEAGARRQDVLEAVVVGNTAMHHLLLNLPVKQLALSPFVPTVNQAVEVKARDLGLNIAPGAYVHLLPNIAGFVGGDHVAMLLVIDNREAEGPILALDIGTNTEISLIDRREFITVSCASVPAFEGGHIKHGMRAATGAIERLRIDGEGIQYQTIGGAPPVGICGSGILDALSQLWLAKVIDESGRITDHHPRVRKYKGEREVILVSRQERKGKPAITITQHDVRELQLAKAAIRSGIQVLLEACGCPEDAIRQVIIAGAFGTYIDISSAVAIGMLPPLPIKRFRQVGNAAGMGAKLALISLAKRTQARDIASKVRYIELASVPSFEATFVQASYLGRFRIVNGRREKLDNGD